MDCAYAPYAHTQPQSLEPPPILKVSNHPQYRQFPNLRVLHRIWDTPTPVPNSVQLVPNSVQQLALSYIPVHNQPEYTGTLPYGNMSCVRYVSSSRVRYMISSRRRRLRRCSKSFHGRLHPRAPLQWQELPECHVRPSFPFSRTGTIYM